MTPDEPETFIPKRLPPEQAERLREILRGTARRLGVALDDPEVLNAAHELGIKPPTDEETPDV